MREGTRTKEQGKRPKEQADQLLVYLAEMKEKLSGIQEEYEEKLKHVRERYDWQVQNCQFEIRELEKKLRSLMKAHDPELFDGRDKVDLPHGLLLRSEGYKVRIPRDALPRIEAQGWLEAIRVVKSINRDVVNKWPDARLVVIGAERRRVVSYEYETRR